MGAKFNFEMKFIKGSGMIDWPCQQITASETVCGRLRDWRKEAIKDQEEFLANQKAFPIEGRWCKEAARHSLKIQRACSLALGWLKVLTGAA